MKRRGTGGWPLRLSSIWRHFPKGRSNRPIKPRVPTHPPSLPECATPVSNSRRIHVLLVTVNGNAYPSASYKEMVSTATRSNVMEIEMIKWLFQFYIEGFSDTRCFTIVQLLKQSSLTGVFKVEFEIFRLKDVLTVVNDESEGALRLRPFMTFHSMRNSVNVYRRCSSTKLWNNFRIELHSLFLVAMTY